jgi:hypothetical protein
MKHEADFFGGYVFSFVAFVISQMTNWVAAIIDAQALCDVDAIDCYGFRPVCRDPCW